MIGVLEEPISISCGIPNNGLRAFRYMHPSHRLRRLPTNGLGDPASSPGDTLFGL